MKQITSFLLLIVLLFSCVEEKDYPVQFSYDYSVKSLINVEDHSAILGDSALTIIGNHPDGTIHIHLPIAPGHALTVGDFTTELNTGFAVYFTSSLGVTTKARLATLTLTHVNSFVNFDFEAELFSGIKLTEGMARNLPIVTEVYFNSIDSTGVPVTPPSNIDTLTNGLYAELLDPKDPFYQASNDILRNETDSSFQFRASSGYYVVDFELMKPLELLVDQSIDITQANQKLVLMQWRDFSQPVGSTQMTLQSGSFKVFNPNLPANELEFGFTGQLTNDINANVPIHAGYGRKL